MSTTQDKMTATHALDVIGVEPHTFDMRLSFQECFVCGAPVNFMRLYNEHKRYCPLHDDATGELRAALDLLNDPLLRHD